MTGLPGPRTAPSGGEADHASPLTLVLLAAGLGSRFGGLKQLAPLGPGGATLMDYSLYDAWRVGFRRAVFVIRPEISEAFEATIGTRYRPRLEIATAFQRLEDLPDGRRPPEGRTRPWGTTQAVLAARDAVGGPFAVLNADDFYGRPALEAVAAFLRRTPPADQRHAVVGYRMEQTASPAGGVNRAVLRLHPDRTLARIVETRDLVRGDAGFTGHAGAEAVLVRGDAPVSMNLWGFFPSIFPLMADGFSRFLAAHGAEEKSEYYLPEAVQEAIAAGRILVDVLPAAGQWCGVTYAEDTGWVRQVLADLTSAGEYPEALWT